VTKAEILKLRLAIKLIHQDGEYEDGMEILCKLAGLVYPAAAAIRQGRLVNLRKFAGAKNQSFRSGLRMRG